jgi:hypothetical protein
MSQPFGGIAMNSNQGPAGIAGRVKAPLPKGRSNNLKGKVRTASPLGRQPPVNQNGSAFGSAAFGSNAFSGASMSRSSSAGSVAHQFREMNTDQASYDQVCLKNANLD